MGTDPLVVDTDGDGFIDAVDPEPLTPAIFDDSEEDSWLPIILFGAIGLAVAVIVLVLLVRILKPEKSR
jgi:hypothetical protein